MWISSLLYKWSIKEGTGESDWKEKKCDRKRKMRKREREIEIGEIESVRRDRSKEEKYRKLHYE